MPDDYYASRKSNLLNDFDNLAKSVRKVLVARYGGALADAMIKETRSEYEVIIPQIPYIGGKQPFTQFVIATAEFLAMYRVMKGQGKTVEETGDLIYEMCEAVIKSYPSFVLRLTGSLSIFSRRTIDALRKGAEESQKREYPGDFVFTFVEGDNVKFDYGIDYMECGPCKFLNKQGAPELAPYICSIDALYSEAFGWGLVRTTTIAEGFDKCDFRFKRGGRTSVLHASVRTKATLRPGG